MGLENLLDSVKDKWLETTVKLSENSVYKYGVDAVSGWLYYTPTYAAQELAAGKDLDTVIKTRLIGLGSHLLTMRPIGLLRNYVAERWNVTEDSPLLDKVKVNVVAVAPVQAVTYGAMLMGSMAWSGNYDWKAANYAWAIGVTLGVFHSIPYGFVQDKIRMFFGVKPAIRASMKRENLAD